MDREKYVIVVAGGSGSRMGTAVPKQFLPLNGKAVLQRTIEKFTGAYDDIHVVVVLPLEHIARWKEYCLENNFCCPQILVKGGMTRFHSVRNALEKIPAGCLVAVHDAVRPFVSTGKIRELYGLAEVCGSAVPVLPCVDTIRRLKPDDGGDGRFRVAPGGQPDRSELFSVQTPQVFRSEVLAGAYSLPYDKLFTDDASVVECSGFSVCYTEGERFNIKLTTPSDMTLAGLLMSGGAVL